MFMLGLMMLTGMYAFIMARKHLLLVLLSLEYLVLGVYLFLYSMCWTPNSYLCLVYIIYTACEAALGLSLLVGVSRSYGSDYLSSFSMYN